MEPSDVSVVMQAGHLFDEAPTERLTERFLAREGHHLILAFDDGQPVGFITGVEVDHPDKQTEMLLYELGVDAGHRRRGNGRALVNALFGVAEERSCRGVWASVEGDDDQAMAFYRSIGQPHEESAHVLWWGVGPTHVADRPLA